MTRTRRLRVVALLGVATIVMAACSSTDPESGTSDTANAEASQGEDLDSGDSGEEAGDEGESRAEGANEAAEEMAQAQERVDAMNEAIAAGRFGTDAAVTGQPSAGWNGEVLLNKKTDDWEPAVAADRHKHFVYALTTRYGAKPICASDCPSPYIPLTISKDGGKTWGKQRPLCKCKGAFGQFDPIIETVPKTGDVYSVFLNGDTKSGFSTVFIRSTDHGKSWTKPVHVYGNVKWTDKPEITMSRNGKDVYVAWNGPDYGDSWVGVSHDHGKTWSQHKVTHGEKYFYAYDATTLPDGTIVFSESGIVSGPDSGEAGTNVWHYALISRNEGRTWTNVLVDKVKRGEKCVAKGCGPEYYLGQTSVASNGKGDLVFAYEGATTDHGPMQVYVRTSKDEGRKWSARTALSVKGENATGPRVDMGPGGNARLWYMQTSGNDNPNAWNVWYQQARDVGSNWRKPVKLSNATSGPGYVTPKGFKEIYGDYGEIAVTNKGKTVAVWGEGFNYTGPGGTWIGLQQ